MFERERRTTRRAPYFSSIVGFFFQRHGSSIEFLAIAIIRVQLDSPGAAVFAEDRQVHRTWMIIIHERDILATLDFDIIGNF